MPLKSETAPGGARLLGDAFPGGNCTSKITKFQPCRQALKSRSAGHEARLRHFAAQLHSLGPKPLFHFLDELERGAPLRQHLERYAALPGDFVRANGRCEFGPIVFPLTGGRGR